MPVATDTCAPSTVERAPGQFARHGKTGAPIVTHPTKTTKQDGNKAELIALCAARGIAVPEKATVAKLQELLGPRPHRVTYGRPSSLGKQIENMTNIQKWSERAVALGLWLELRSMVNMHGEFAAFDGRVANGILMELAAFDPQDLDDKEAKTLLDSIAVRAKNTAQAGLAADRGTHHHELTEDHDNEVDWINRAERGEDLGVSQPVQAALVAAWSKMLEQFDIEILAVEATCVDDLWRQAGTLDRICRLRKPLRFITTTGEYVELPAGWVGILDLKTGKLRLDRSGFVSYWHGYAVQLASYAHSVRYNPDTDERTDWEWSIDQQYAVIAHLDILAALEGEAVCRLVLVDLEAGRHAGALCVAAREWEARTNVFSIPVDELAVRVPVAGQVAVSTPSAVLPEGVDIALNSASIGPASPVLAETVAVPEPTNAPAPHGLAGGDTEGAFASAPTGAGTANSRRKKPAPTTARDGHAARKAVDRLHTKPDEGAQSTPGTFATLQSHYQQLPEDAKDWVKTLSNQADAAGVPFTAKGDGNRTVRRFELLAALVNLAKEQTELAPLRELVTAVIGTHDIYTDKPLGHLIGSMNAIEAARFAALANGTAALTFDDDGTPQVAA